MGPKFTGGKARDRYKDVEDDSEGQLEIIGPSLRREIDTKKVELNNQSSGDQITNHNLEKNIPEKAQIIASGLSE